LEALQDRIARQEGFLVKEHKLELYGYCQTCSRKGKDSTDRGEMKAGIHG
jgi:Fe2+ or Zn2+ uptake regulation protein